MANLYFLIGPPASGKSTLAKRLGYTIVCPDDIRVRCRAHSAEAFRIARQDIIAALKRSEDVVFDATNTIARWRKETILAGKKYADTVICILMDTNKAECLRRHHKRIRNGVRASMGDEVIHRMFRQLNNNLPTLEEGFDKIVLSSSFN